MRAMVVVVILVGCAPLRPGQTRCTTSPLFGSVVTNCQSGPPLQAVPAYGPTYTPPPAAPAPPPPGWWCTARPDGFGACVRAPGQCEVYRAGAPEGSEFAPCQFSMAAICSSSGCYTSPVACASMERQAGRDGSLCVVVQ